MKYEWIYSKVNGEAEEEYRYQRDPYEFAMRNLWLPRSGSWSTPALHAFRKEIYPPKKLV